ncbi:MAG: O-antigen ligase family protein [Lacunisphaera sp.]
MTTPNPTQTPPCTTRLLALAALAGLAMTLAYPSATRQFAWPWVLLLCVVWIIPLGAAIAAFAKATAWRRPNLLLTVGLCLLVAATLTAASASPFARLSILRIWPTLSGVALLFWLHDWLNQSVGSGEFRSKLLAQGIAVGGAIIAMVSLIGWRWESIGKSGIVRNDVPFGHSTYTAGALVLVLPWLIHESLKSTRLRRTGWLTVALGTFVALLATSSRGGVLAIGAVGAIGAGLVGVRAPWSRRNKVIVVGLTVAILGLAVFANPRLREMVRIGGWGHSSQESNAQRNAMLEAGWRMGADRPLTGWGPGTVPLVYPHERWRLHGGVDNVLQLHNTPAQLWAGLGLGGALALILLVTAVIRRLFQLMRQPTFRTIHASAAASVVGYGLFSLTDHQLDLPAMNALLVLALALLFQGDPATTIVTAPRTSRRLAVVGASVLLVTPLILGLQDLRARYAYEQSMSAFETGRPADGLVALEKASTLAPYDPYYRQQFAGRLLAERFQTADAAKQRALAQAATTQLERSLDAGCFQEFAHFNLGWLALDDAKPLRAAAHFLGAAKEAPHRGGVYFGLGLALRNAGDEFGAVRAFALEWIDDPVTATAPIWEWPDFAPLRPKVEEEADGLLAELAPADPTAVYVRQLWSWWKQGGAFPTREFSPESVAFAATVKALAEKREPPAAAENYRWGTLINAWKQSGDVAALTMLGGPDADFGVALVHRKSRHPFPDWHGFFTAGVENEPSLLVNYRSRRLGYGVLALHPDGPILTDLYVRQENRFVSTFASSLFPVKGWLLARELVNRLPVIPTAPP